MSGPQRTSWRHGMVKAQPLLKKLGHARHDVRTGNGDREGDPWLKAIWTPPGARRRTCSCCWLGSAIVVAVTAPRPAGEWVSSENDSEPTKPDSASTALLGEQAPQPRVQPRACGADGRRASLPQELWSVHRLGVVGPDSREPLRRGPVDAIVHLLGATALLTPFTYLLRCGVVTTTASKMCSRTKHPRFDLMHDEEWTEAGRVDAVGDPLLDMADAKARRAGGAVGHSWRIGGESVVVDHRRYEVESGHELEDLRLQLAQDVTPPRNFPPAAGFFMATMLLLG